MSFTVQLAIDCTNPHDLADWWAETLSWTVEAQDESFIRRMIAEGLATDADTTTRRGALVWAEAAAISAPEDHPQQLRMLFQQVPESKVVKNRLHLDIRIGAEDADTARARLVERGAVRLREGHQGPHTWVTFADPEGNEFCL
jgi:hypothetical protein